MTITFEGGEDGAVFLFGEDDDTAVQELDDLLDRRDAGKLTTSNYITKVKGIIARYPDFIDGYAHLGGALFHIGKFKAALDAYLGGFMLGESAIPPAFRGVIEWGYLGNRPFLRAAHGVVLCYLVSGDRQKALDIMERMLTWNPK